MSHKIVQLHQGNDPDWDNIYPITTPEAISDSSGKSLQEMLNEKQDKVFLVTVTNAGREADHHYSEIKAAIAAGKEAVCYDVDGKVYLTLWKDFDDNSIVFYGFAGASTGHRVTIGETTSSRVQVNYQTLSNITKSTDVWDGTSDVKYPSLKAVDGHCAPLSHVSDTGVHVNATEKDKIANALSSAPIGTGVDPTYPGVEYVAQTLTDVQKAQARENIGAVPVMEKVADYTLSADLASDIIINFSKPCTYFKIVSYVKLDSDRWIPFHLLCDDDVTYVTPTCPFAGFSTHFYLQMYGVPCSYISEFGLRDNVIFGTHSYSRYSNVSGGSYNKVGLLEKSTVKGIKLNNNAGTFLAGSRFIIYGY